MLAQHSDISLSSSSEEMGIKTDCHGESKIMNLRGISCVQKPPRYEIILLFGICQTDHQLYLVFGFLVIYTNVGLEFMTPRSSHMLFQLSQPG